MRPRLVRCPRRPAEPGGRLPQLEPEISTSSWSLAFRVENEIEVDEVHWQQRLVVPNTLGDEPAALVCI
jgi:hypothetical protein